MASPLCSLFSLPKSLASIPGSFNGCPKELLGRTLQSIRRTKCFKRFLLKCGLRGIRVAGFKRQLDFSKFSLILEGETDMNNQHFKFLEGQEKQLLSSRREDKNDLFWRSYALSIGISSWFSFCQVAESKVGDKLDMVYETGELFELGIQLSYLLILLGLLGLGTFYVIRQVLVRRELDLSAKELQEQVRSGDATATEYFELGAVMLRRKYYPAAIKYLQQAIDKWDRDDQDLAQAYNALGVSYVRENKLEKGIAQFEAAVKLQPGYVTAWNNMGDAYEKKKDLRSALKAFEEVLLFDPNNKVARPRRDALRERVQLFKGVPLKSEEQ